MKFNLTTEKVLYWNDLAINSESDIQMTIKIF